MSYLELLSFEQEACMDKKIVMVALEGVCDTVLNLKACIVCFFFQCCDGSGIYFWRFLVLESSYS